MKAISHPQLAVLLIATGWSGATVVAQPWDGGGTDNNWSTFDNWNPAGSPADAAITFANTDKTTSSLVNSIVDTNFTIDSLTFNNTGTDANDWHNLQINSGFTLTLNAAATNILTVGGLNGASPGAATITTRVKIGGSGSLLINEPTSNVLIGNFDNAATGGAATGQLDLSGLASFTATVNNFDVGQGNRSVGLLTLGTSSTITASKLSVGYSSNLNANAPSILNLGGSTTLHVADIYVGAPPVSGNNHNWGTLRFDPALAGGAPETVVLRGQTGGTSRANLIVGQNSNDGATPASRSVTGITDFAGGSVDALLDTLLIGHSEGNTSGGNVTGTLSMSLGTIDANTVVVGRTGLTSNSSAPTATGNLNVSGGTFTANSAIVLAYNIGGAQSVAGNLNVSGTGVVNAGSGIVMGRKWPTATASAVTATVNVSGGTLISGGNLAEHAENTNVTSVVNLSGGVLELSHQSVAVDSFNFTGGTLKNVASFATATSGGLELQNAATLSFDLDNSFTTLSLMGTLQLSDSSNLELALADGFAPGTSFTLVDNDVLDAIIGTFATINGAAFGAGNTFFLSNDLGSYEYALFYNSGSGNDLVIQAVPEPSTCTLLAGTLVLLAGQRRQKRTAQESGSVRP